jgi:uncharacterized protein YjbI with pentapeptide repeats
MGPNGETDLRHRRTPPGGDVSGTAARAIDRCAAARPDGGVAVRSVRWNRGSPREVPAARRAPLRAVAAQRSLGLSRLDPDSSSTGAASMDGAPAAPSAPLPELTAAPAIAHPPPPARAELAWTALAGADLRGANLRFADLTGADLTGARLDGADLSAAELAGARLQGASLEGATLSDARCLFARLADARLDGADLTRAFLHHADLRGASARDARLTWARLMHATLAGARLAGADLTGVTLRFADCAGAEMDHAMLEFADASRAALGGASLRHAFLAGAVLDRATLAGADLGGASVGRTLFTGCADLHLARGLDALSYLAPVVLDGETLRACGDRLPRALLEAAGLAGAELPAGGVSRGAS